MNLADALKAAANAAEDLAIDETGTERVRLRALSQVLRAEARVAVQKEPQLITVGGRFRYA